jgi:hypothetical protein
VTVAKLSSTIHGKGFSEGEDTSSMIRISSTPDNQLLSEKMWPSPVGKTSILKKD